MRLTRRQVTFTRRARLSEDQCYASRDYYDVCLANEEHNKTTIVPPAIWYTFRPTPDLVYSEGTYMRYVCLSLLFVVVM